MLIYKSNNTNSSISFTYQIIFYRLKFTTKFISAVISVAVVSLFNRKLPFYYKLLDLHSINYPFIKIFATYKLFNGKILSMGLDYLIVLQLNFKKSKFTKIIKDLSKKTKFYGWQNYT